MPLKETQPIKILHLISTLDVGGAEKNLCRLVCSMDNASYTSVVVSMTDVGPVGKKIMENEFPVHALNMKKGFPDPRGIYHLKKLVSHYQPDIIQCWMYHANLFGLLFCHKRPLVWNIRCSDMDLSRYGFVYKYTVKAGAFFSKIPDVVIANSFAGKEFHERLGYNPRRWEVFTNGFDTDLFRFDKGSGKQIRLESGISMTAPVIGLIARFDPMKDHATFINAACLLLKTHPDAHFVLAGKNIETKNQSIMKHLLEASQRDHFHLLGQRDDIPQIISALDISTSSSWGEGLPNTIGEAMATGIPCVVTDAGDSRELVGDTGVVVPTRDPAALCDAWVKLIEAGVDVRREMGIRARNRIEKHFSLDTAVESYQDLYQKIITATMQKKTA